MTAEWQVSDAWDERGTWAGQGDTAEDSQDCDGDGGDERGSDISSGGGGRMSCQQHKSDSNKTIFNTTVLVIFFFQAR